MIKITVGFSVLSAAMIARALGASGDFGMFIIVLMSAVICFLTDRILRIYVFKKGAEDHNEEKLAAEMMRAREKQVDRMLSRWKWMQSRWK